MKTTDSSYHNNTNYAQHPSNNLTLKFQQNSKAAIILTPFKWFFYTLAIILLIVWQINTVNHLASLGDIISVVTDNSNDNLSDAASDLIIFAIAVASFIISAIFMFTRFILKIKLISIIGKLIHQQMIEQSSDQLDQKQMQFMNYSELSSARTMIIVSIFIDLFSILFFIALSKVKKVLNYNK